jgi:hypothetical protein
VVILLLALAICAVNASSHGHVGGAKTPRVARPPSGSVVVDALNLTHWLRDETRAAIPDGEVGEMIGATAPLLKKKFRGRVIYVVKDRETAHNAPATRELYAAAARENQVHVVVVERYHTAAAPRAAPLARAQTRPHSARARDDFMMAVLAQRWRCPVLTADKLRDFAEFRGALEPFYTFEYSYWDVLPTHEYINPASTAYSRLKKPRTLDPSAVF